MSFVRLYVDKYLKYLTVQQPTKVLQQVGLDQHCSTVVFQIPYLTAILGRWLSLSRHPESLISNKPLYLVIRLFFSGA